MRLILGLIVELLLHELSLHVEQALLIFALLDLFEQLTVALLVDLVDDLPKHIVVVAAVEVDTLAEAVTHFAVNKCWHEGVR